ncbi:hypothetical protein B0H19DRAFT_1267121 [Mycena capillaripes]|nr:hypothetical protein B0H19DRAFT_1267121 [Mycena capillaripes]
MPRIPSSRQPSSRTLAPYRETAESKARRRRNYPNDCYLDFDTQILAMFWTKDGAVPGQVTVYPRDDLRVRLSDHKIALAEAGFEMNDRGIHVFVPPITNMDGGCADCACEWGWAECGWDTPLRVHAAGDAILLSYADVEDLKDFYLHERHCTFQPIYPSHSMVNFKKPASETEAMLREVVPRPDEDDFNFDPCPKGYSHGFQLDGGGILPHRRATWALLCDGSADSSMLGEPVQRCAPQRGKHFPPDTMEVYKLSCDLERAFAVIYEQRHDNLPALPPKAADRMSIKLNHTRRVIEGLNPDYLPDNPDILDTGLDVKGKSKEINAVIDTADSDSDSDFEDDVFDVFDTPENALELVLPTNAPGCLACVAIFFKRGTPPYVAKWWAPDPTSFTFDTYAFPHSSPNTSFLLYKMCLRFAPAYSTTDEGYTNVAQPLNLVGRGKYLVFRKDTINPVDCPGLSKWKQRARDSAEAELADQGQFVTASSRPPSSVPRSSADDELGDEVSTQLDIPRAVHTPIAGPSRLKRRGLKRKAMPEDAAMSKKQKLQVRGDTSNDPLVIATSDPDYYSDSSDVVIVEK